MENSIIFSIDEALDESAYAQYEKSIAEIAEKAILEEGLSGCEAEITLVDNEFIHEINRTYRNVDRETDVISFPANDLPKPINEMLKDDDFEPEIGEDGEKIYLGEIYISVEKTALQAEEYGNTFLEELRFLTVHGMLHIMGYDHIVKEDELVMRAKQRIILGRELNKDYE